MPAFASADDVAFWVRRQPRDVAVAFAARAALRIIPVVPFMSRRLRLGAGDQRYATLTVFRGAQTAWSVAAYPGELARLQRAARAAGAIVDDMNMRAPKYGYEIEGAATCAAAAAGTGEDSRRFTPDVPRYVVKASIDAGPEAGDDLLKSMAVDADFLDQHVDPVSLALSSPLWPGPMPDWAFNGWADLERALLGANEDWEVWTDWYEARLKSGEADQILEVARATIPNSTWDQGAKVVNAQIRAFYEERGIWRHATTDEPSPEDVKTDELQKALEVLSKEGQALIGARVAARAVPLFTFGSAADPDFEADLLLMMRTVSTAIASAIGRSTFPVPYSEALTSKIGILRAAANAVSASADLLFPTDTIANGIISLRSVFAEANGGVAATAFDAALSRDISALASSAPAVAARVPLWTSNEPPGWEVRRWNILRRELLRVGHGWEVWVDWYEYRLAGRTRPEGRLPGLKRC